MFPGSSFHQGIAATTDEPMSSANISESMFLNAANFEEDLKALLYSNDRQTPTTAYFPNQPSVYQNVNNNRKGGIFVPSPQQNENVLESTGHQQEIEPGI